MIDSRITTTLDLQRDGKQFGHLQIPHSSNTSGWGSVLLPMIVVKRGAGPTALLVGGNHGDEYEGPIALLKLAQELDPEILSGRVIILPGLNHPALLSGTRLSPLDGCNMNRLFPGRRDGSVSEMIAHYVYHGLLPEADVVVDLHSGGSSMIFTPCAVIHRLEDRAQQAACLAAAQAFGAPILLVLRELDRQGMLDTAAEDMGKVFVSTELGGGGFLTPSTLHVAERGLRNVLRHFSILPGQPEGDTSRLMATPEHGAYEMAWVDGLYEPVYEVGSVVSAGDTLGRIYDPDRPANAPVDLTAAIDGVLITRAGRGQVRRGDTLAVLATDIEVV